MKSTMWVLTIVLGAFALSGCGGQFGDPTGGVDPYSIDGQYSVTDEVTQSTIPSVPVGATNTYDLAVVTDGDEVAFVDEIGVAFTGTRSGNEVNVREVRATSVFSATFTWTSEDAWSGTAKTEYSNGNSTTFEATAIRK